MVDEESNFLGEIGLILLGIILAITFIPLCIGVLFALVINATGLTYFLAVLGIACVIWVLLGIFYWI